MSENNFIDLSAVTNTGRRYDRLRKIPCVLEVFGEEQDNPCQLCDGSGYLLEDQCSLCEGRGTDYGTPKHDLTHHHPATDMSVLDEFATHEKDKICPTCGGVGFCSWCEGTGKVRRNDWSHLYRVGAKVRIDCGNYQATGTVLKRCPGLTYEVEITGEDIRMSFSEGFLAPACFVCGLKPDGYYAPTPDSFPMHVCDGCRNSLDAPGARPRADIKLTKFIKPSGTASYSKELLGESPKDCSPPSEHHYATINVRFTENEM